MSENTDRDMVTKESSIFKIADAIRTKGGTSADLTYPDGFVSAIENIPVGDPQYRNNIKNISIVLEASNV